MSLFSSAPFSSPPPPQQQTFFPLRLLATQNSTVAMTTSKKAAAGTAMTHMGTPSVALATSQVRVDLRMELRRWPATREGREHKNLSGENTISQLRTEMWFRELVKNFVLRIKKCFVLKNLIVAFKLLE